MTYARAASPWLRTLLARPRPPRGCLAACVVGAFLLRAVGANYGLPWVYHSDTPKQLDLVVPFMRGALVPETAYPVLHMYVLAAIFKTVTLLDPFAFGPGPSWTAVVAAARLLNAALGAGTVALVYDAARRLFGWRVGLFAAALLAVSPVSIVHAHYEMGDVAQTFFVMASLDAAAAALVAGRAGAFLAAGALAGLAGAAKFFGCAVFASTLVAALGAPHRTGRQRAGLVVAAAGMAGLAFVVGTPKLVLAPRAWIEGVTQVPSGLFLPNIPRPPWYLAPVVGGRALAGLALEFLGPAACVAAAGGALVLARRGWRGGLILAPPAVFTAIYVLFRPHGLDDRYLVVLAPFVALTGALAVAAIRPRMPRAAVAAGAALAVAGTVGSLHATYLFWEEDTREFAQRWRERHVPPDARITPSLADDRTAAAGERMELVISDTQSNDRFLRWHSPRRDARVVEAAAALERDGKLLRRFELLPWGFTAPTIVVYELDPARAPYAFPPADAVTADERVVFVDPDAVPDRAGVTVMPGRPITLTLVARRPLAEVTLALSGSGRLRLRSGVRSRTWALDPVRPQLVTVQPWRGFPWFKPVYRIRLAASGGRAAVRILGSPCDAGELLLDRGEGNPAIPHLHACRGTRWAEPARLLHLARAQAGAGAPEAARATLAELGRVAPGLLEGLRALLEAPGPDDSAWRERYAALLGRGRTFWRGQTFHVEAETTPAPLGLIVEAKDASGGRLVRAFPGTTPPGHLKVWFPQHFLRGRFVATFRLRAPGDGRPAATRPAATLEVVGHHPGGGHAVLRARDWSPPPGLPVWQDVALPFETEVEPMDVELRLRYHERGPLDVDWVTIVPDVRPGLAAQLAPLRAFGATPVR